jgi:Molybdopterin cofactor-binding domain
MPCLVSYRKPGLRVCLAVGEYEDGTVIVSSGSVDIGGSRASMALMAAETLGVDYNQVRSVVADSSSVGFTNPTGGSRVTFATGMAVVEGCSDWWADNVAHSRICKCSLSRADHGSHASRRGHRSRFLGPLPALCRHSRRWRGGS